MTLWDELYFEATLHGLKSELKKFVNFLKSGDLDDFFEITSDYIIYDDNFNDVDDSEESEIIFTNDDYGVEIDEFDTDEFLEIFCKGGKNLHLSGQFFDSDDTEFRFVSNESDSSFIDADKIDLFNDELDARALEEESAEDKDNSDY